MGTSIKVIEDALNAAISHLGLLEIVVCREMNYEHIYNPETLNSENEDADSMANEVSTTYTIFTLNLNH